ncbi:MULTISPECIES: hypothetical protein [unclassified Endozoicomonas]|uniref:hypothetical protein n=1 Tax=unclassified Endozoicomonas TaxID=2644528 RepID=UPI003BB6C315
MASKIKLSSLTKDDSEAIGFVMGCLFSSSVSVEEFNKWAMMIVDKVELDQIPPFIFDLISFQGSLTDIYKTIGFTPVWKRSNEEDAALFGIAIKRGREVYDMPVSSSVALKCLENNPHIEDIFNEMFPFITISGHQVIGDRS